MTPFHSVPVVFYKEDSGREPVKEWIFSLDKIGRKVIGKDIRTVQMGRPIGMPLVRSLGSGLWEIRSHIPNGNDRWRNCPIAWFYKKNSKNS